MRRRITFLFTLDVHSRTPTGHSRAADLAACLDALQEAGITATFFVPAACISECERSFVRRLVGDGHQLGCHGLLHAPPEDFVHDSVDVQIARLRQAKAMLEDAAQVTITAFRAPSFLISPATIVALEACAFRADLSVNSQALGVLGAQPHTLPWLTAPRDPYHPGATSPYCRGALALWEITLTAFMVPFQSDLYQGLGVPLTRTFARAMLLEAKHRRRKPVVYMGHPEEFYPSRLIRVRLRPTWRNFIPQRGHGILARYLLLENDEYKIYRMNSEFIAFLGRAAAPLEYLTVDQYLDRLECAGPGCASSGAIVDRC